MEISKIRKINIALQMTSVSFTLIGTILGSVTLNPIVGGCLAGQVL